MSKKKTRKNFVDTSKSSEPKRYHPWYGLIFNLKAPDRQKWVDVVLQGMEEKAELENNNALRDVVKFLRDKKRCHIVGFTNGFEYLMSGNHDKRDDWDKSYIHAAGAAMLFVKHVDLPVYMLVSPEAKWGESDLPVQGVIGGTG
jgi:hypothetical protein